MVGAVEVVGGRRGSMLPNQYNDMAVLVFNPRGFKICVSGLLYFVVFGRLGG